MSDRTPNWPGALKKTNFQIHSCHPQSGSNPGPWILTTGTVLYQLSWVEVVTHPITNTAQWCLTSVMYEIPVYQLYHSATDKSLGWGTTLLSCVLQSRSWCSEPCHEFRTTWPLVLLSYKDTRSELTAHLILPHESSIAHPPISGVRINYDDEVAWFLHHAMRHCEPSTWKLVNSMIWMFT